MGKPYLVAIGLSYNDKRAEPGDVIDDLPEEAIEDLLALHAIAATDQEVPKRRKGN